MLSLARQAAQHTRDAFTVATITILLFLLVGIITIVMLGIVWRRYNKRLNRTPEKKQDCTDLWRAAADRIPDDYDQGEDDNPDPN